MGKFTVTPEQKEELKSSDSTTPLAIEGADGQGKGTYHNPVTGQEIRSLLDPWHLMKRLRQGWQLGPASPELREKWKVRQAELRAEDDAMEAAHVASGEYRESEANRFNDAVTEATKVAVKAALEQLNIDLPGKAGVEEAVPTPAPEDHEPGGKLYFKRKEEYTPCPEGTQLPLWSDATPESETKLIVSQASQPDTSSVGHREEQT